MEKKKSKLVVDGNSLYEIDLECENKRKTAGDRRVSYVTDTCAKCRKNKRK